MSVIMLTPHWAPTVPLPGLPPSDDTLDHLARYYDQTLDDGFDAAGDEETVRNSIEKSGPSSGVARVRHLLPDAVLLKIAPGHKRPCAIGWQKVTHADMTPEYLESLQGQNVGVLLGPASGHLNSIDIDADEFVEPFLELNPRLRQTLRSKRVRGCNIWVIVPGEYPKLSKIKTADGEDWGEWRSTGGQTLIHGEVMDKSKGESTPTAYRILNEVKPIEIAFDEIRWPENLILPWRIATTAHPPLPPVVAQPGKQCAEDDGVIILPGGEVTISECADRLFRRIAPTRTLFFRGGAVMEAVMGDDGALALEIVKPAAFRSRIEGYGRLLAWRSGANRDPVLKPSICPEETARALLETREAQEALPRIASVINSPVMIEDGEELMILPQGYHAHNGGLLVTDGSAPPEIPFEEALESLRSLLVEFDFQTPGDRARALAQLITPALKLGGFIKGFVPADVAEADQSQSGKTFRQRLNAAIYKEKPRVVAKREGGVGSVDESFSQALISGKPFIQFDNFRGKFDSQFIEAFLTATGGFGARVPHRGEVLVDPRRFLLQMTSNGVEATRDMANRSCIVRIRKRVGANFRVFPEGDLFDHVIMRQPHFLGCVFAVIRRWVDYGKPRTNVTDHDFREWAQVLDWIVQHIFNAGPLLAGHQAAQDRVSNPAMTFLRFVALEIRASGRLGATLLAGNIVDICEEAGIEIPGLKSASSSDASRKVGILMKRAFADANAILIDEFNVTRTRDGRERSSGGVYLTWTYQFCQVEHTTAQAAQDARD